MKKYIVKVTQFFIPLFMVIVILSIYLKQKHQFLPSSSYYYKDFNTAFQEKDMHIIALGNSKLLSAIDKNILQENNENKVAVLGYSSANISVSKLTLEAYLNHCSITPKKVLLEVSWFTFNTERTHLHNIVGELFIKDPYLWKNYFDYKDEMGDGIKRAFKKTISLKPKADNTRLEMSYADRFVKDYSPNTINYKFDLKKLENVFPNHIAGIDSQLLKDYHSLVRMCVNNDIELILFTAPEDETYSKYQKDITEIKSIFKKTSNDFTDVFYLDYSYEGKYYDKNYEKWLKDSHHVNENQLFTKVLLNDIKFKTTNSIN
nr:hypothetical protein [uncultured Psychroserpens sp.]